jgi:hypothetical protein
MTLNVTTRIPFSVTTVSKCMCPKCPAQLQSKCAREKLPTIPEALRTSKLKREYMPGVYCSTGTAI